jgi:hypothetical protein
MRIARRLPFTLLMELSIAGVAVAERAVLGKLSPTSQRRWGFGLHNLWERRFYTAFTAPFFVRDLHMLLGILLLIGYSIGILEWKAGTRKTLLIYWCTNVLSLWLAALLVVAPSYRAGTAQGTATAFLSDVGPSAGGLGCIGGWVRYLPDRYRHRFFWIILAYLLGKLLLFPELFADSAHLVAFPMGYLLATRLKRQGANPS